jgi:hypothetical protein
MPMIRDEFGNTILHKIVSELSETCYENVNGLDDMKYNFLD